MMLEVLKIMMVYFTTNLTTVIKYLYFVLAFIFVFFQINVIHAFNLIIYRDIPRRVWSVMSPLHYAAIHLIRAEICKSKAPVSSQFRSKIIKTSFDGCNSVKRFTEKYFLQILLKNVGFIGKKPEQGMREM